MGEYLVAGETGAPAVVVVHDWYGQLPHVRALADDLAAAGFTAVAVDLYGGRTTTDAAEAEQLLDALDGAVARETITAAVRDLRGSGVMAPRISAVSFSMGGMIALQLAKAGLFDAAVAYYATASPDDVPMPCPIQLHLAEVDDFEPEDLPRQFTAAVRASGGSATDYTYAGTVHSFANADVPAYHHPEAAAQAWQRTLAFLAGGG